MRLPTLSTRAAGAATTGAASLALAAALLSGCGAASAPDVADESSSAASSDASPTTEKTLSPDGAETAVRSFVAAFARGDGAAACGHLDAAYAQQVVTSVAKIARASTCAGAIEQASRLTDGADYDLDPATVSGTVSGTTATVAVTYTKKSSIAQTYRLSHGTGGWRIVSETDRGNAPHRTASGTSDQPAGVAEEVAAWLGGFCGVQPGDSRAEAVAAMGPATGTIDLDGRQALRWTFGRYSFAAALDGGDGPVTRLYADGTRLTDADRARLPCLAARS